MKSMVNIWYKSYQIDKSARDGNDNTNIHTFFLLIFWLANRLDIGEFMKSPLSMFTTDSRFFVSTKWTRRDTIVDSIHLHHSTLYLPGNIIKYCFIFSKDISSESILGIIGKLYGFTYGGKCNNRKNRTKYLLSPHEHIRRNSPKECWSKI